MENKKIKVCDAIMGTGKSSAAITYMNEHPLQKFIYITPYLDEAKRIRESCPDLNFYEPSNKLPEFGFRKYSHTIELMSAGKNITSTHNLFLKFTDEMIDLIKKQNYILIIDEAVDVLRMSDVSSSDIQLLKDAGWMNKDENGEIIITPTFDYKSGVAKRVLDTMKGNRLIEVTDINGKEHYYYWLFHKNILTAFKDVIVLTYLFEAQTMKYYLDIMDIGYEKIGIERDPQGGYHFSDTLKYLPAYTKTLSEMIHIFDNDKLNHIGNNKNALSVSWFKRGTSHTERVETLRKNVRNYFINYHGEISCDKRLWATFKSAEKLIRAKGFYYSDIAFNTKATNDYRDRQVLAYCVNIFMQPHEKLYLTNKGVDVLEDRYALSVMIQWIWRSAIRDGKEIWIYIPSKRMRKLLQDWIEETENNYYTYKGEH